MGFIDARKLVHEFIRRDEENNVESITTALDHVDLEIEEGQFVAILGHNGSGKSTLAKHINALLSPSEGDLYVGGLDTSEEENIMPVRRKAGMVFQNPDNQIVASVVEEDVAFGPENLGVPTREIQKRVADSLAAVGMTAYKRESPNHLSGGQKQRVAIAGVMAMENNCVVFDESTAMLDPNGRAEVLAAAHRLNRENGVTVLWITHYMEEVTGADYVYVMEKGQIVMQGSPRQIFSQVDDLKKYRLDVPQITSIGDRLRKNGLPLPAGILSRQELVKEVLACTQNPMSVSCAKAALLGLSGYEKTQARFQHENPNAFLILNHVKHCYSQGTAYEKEALSDLSFSIEKGQFVGIIGHTGSGKSTLIQHLNGLLEATEGHIYFNGEDICDKNYDKRKLREKVGLVFQYPEYQLFEATVFDDVCFGPKNQKLDAKTVELRAFEALESVHFPEELFYQPPFDLSGGQKRRAAIAGVLAMRPEILILDEPTAGLDPAGRDEILEMLADLHKEKNITIILVSHSMEDVANYVDRLLVMDGGKLLYDDTPKQVFSHYRELETMGLAAPQVTYLMHDLKEFGLEVNTEATTETEAVYSILSAVAGQKRGGEAR